MDPDLRGQLEHALGSTYTIERELGGGGMSRVFLARELALDRVVVLKVLPPEMAAAVSIERFRREIRLAASLQHPYIVPLHSAGQAGELLYYSMPLVEGESLRAKLAREGALPMSDAVRVLRDVADALTYAHAHGVVHRDIKPDNILISGHHAVVTDFGVAKAMSVASGSGSLTSMGVALGTPAYMAPEQAAADPHVDHRVDLYALGAVGYEMLCGRPPFVGMTPQQVLAAHVTQTPEPCTTSRPTVPPALNALVMRCLEKRPADRPQRADEIVSQLEAMATPSSGMQPTTAVRPEPPAAVAPSRRIPRPALIAAGVVAAAVALYAALRLLGVLGPRTLIAAGVMSDQQRIVLADFENRSADTTLGPTLTEAFRVDLAQSRAIQLVDPTAVSDALARMQRPAHDALTPALAREVAERGGIRAVVTGEIASVGTGYLLSASVVSAADGRVLAAVHETARNADALLAALDRLSGDLRAEIGESLRSIRAGEPLEQVTTGSMDALRKYSAAIRLTDAGDDAGAVPLLEAATDADTGFAMAYRKLAVSLHNSGASTAAANAAATKAFVRRARLPEVERDQAEAYYYMAVEQDRPKAIASYQAVLALRPDDQVALGNLGILMGVQGQYAAAESLMQRSIATNPDAHGYASLALYQARAGHFAAAESSAAYAAQLAPTGTLVLSVPISIAAWQQDYAGADAAGQRALAQLPPRSSLYGRTLTVLAGVSLGRGHLAEAERRDNAAMSILESAGLPGAALIDAIDLGYIDLVYRNRPEAARATVAAVLARHPLASIPVEDRPYGALARFYAAAGRLDDARRTLADYERAVPDGPRQGDGDFLAAQGDIAAAEGHPDQAIEGYEAYLANHACPGCAYFQMAELYQRSGARDSAIAYYSRAVSAPGAALARDVRGRAASYQRLGELEEQKGDRAAAIAAYGHFVDLWSGADPELQPIVRDVHSRIARLSGEH